MNSEITEMAPGAPKFLGRRERNKRRFSGLSDLRQEIRALEMKVEAELVKCSPPVEADYSRKPSIKLVQSVVARAFGQPVEIMTSKERPQMKAWPRQVAMALAWELTGKSSTEIGLHFGGRDHGTVIHARTCVKNACDVEPETVKMMAKLREYLLPETNAQKEQIQPTKASR